MSDNYFNDNHPTPDSEAFYQKQFEQWDREAEAQAQERPEDQNPPEQPKAPEPQAQERPEDQNPPEQPKAPEPPREQVDTNGFRVLTLHVGGRKRGERRERRVVPQVDEEEDALEAMLEANSNRSEKVTFLPFVAQPSGQSDEPPVPEEPDLPQNDLAEEQPPVEQEPSDGEQPVAEAPEKIPAPSVPKAEDPEPARKPEEPPETPVPVHIPKRLRRVAPEPVMIRLESEEDEEEAEAVTPPPAQEASEEQAPVQSAPASQPQSVPKTPETPQEESEASEEEAELEQELEERASRPGLLGRLFGSWFEERMEGQQRQSDADVEYELEHAEEQKNYTPSVRLPKLPGFSLGKRRKKGGKPRVESVEGEVVTSAPPEKKPSQPAPEPTTPKPAAGEAPAPEKRTPTGRRVSTKTAPVKKGPAKATPSGKGEAGPSRLAQGQEGEVNIPSVGRRPEKVVRMPEEHSGLLEQKLSAIRDQADEFADTMFASESEERKAEEAEQARVAKLIPATDEEREARPRDIAREERRRKKEEKQRHAPDTSPKELFRIYSSSYKSRHGRLPAQLGTAVVLLVLTAAAGKELTFLSLPTLVDNPRLAALVLTLGLVLACAVGLDTLLEGIVWLLRGRPGLNTLSSIGALFTLADGIWYATVGREGPLPFAGFAALSLWAMAFGGCRKTRGLRDACEDAYTRSEYERLTMDEGKWSGKGVYLKEPGGGKRFGSQIQEPDGAERAYRFAAPVMMAACTIFGVMACVAQKAPHMLIWNWSVIFIMATPLSATLAYGMPYARQVLRLRRAGVILAGWDGAESMRGDAGIVLTDRDLFPEGTVQMMGIQNFGDISLEKVTGCTASLVRQADLGIAKLFDDQLRIQGGFYRRVDQMDTREESGCTGVMRGDTVMIGTAGYLQVHGIEIEPGYQVKNAVFCGVNGNLRGIFALRYDLPRGVKPAIQTLLQGGISPILATRDFNITPEVLHTRFKLPSDRLQYPPVQRRYDLSAKGQPHNKVLGALIFREGLGPYTDAILGGRRLCSVVRLNTLLTLLASVLGSLLGLYLTAMNAFHSLSLLNTLFFLLMWLVPTVMISRGVDQF